MDFYKLIKSLDELVFEVLSWLLFYPLTLWRVLTAPVATMAMVESELREDEEHSFGEILGPPLFLALTLALIHVAEMVYTPQNMESLGDGKFGTFFADDTNLLAFRIVLFGSLPLIASVRQVRLQRLPVEKSTLRSSVYAQCYAAAVYALLFNASLIVAQLVGVPKGGVVLFGGILGSLLWLGWVETRWFHRNVGLSRGKAFGQSLRVLAQWLLLAAVVLSLTN